MQEFARGQAVSFDDDFNVIAADEPSPYQVLGVLAAVCWRKKAKYSHEDA